MTSPALALDLSTTTVLVDVDGMTSRVAGSRLRSDLEALVAGVRSAGGEIILVSDDRDLPATATCRSLGADVLSPVLDRETGAVVYPEAHRRCPCSTCAICKQAPIKDAQHAGRTAVLVTATLDDAKAALLADVVFAAGSIADWCRVNGIPHRPIETLDEVRVALVG
jgi:hypothetical protein